MDNDVIATHLGNLDRRLASVEQILPTLATKEELKTLATKEELRAAIAPLATKEELRDAIREEGERLREHMTICMQRVSRDIHALIDAIELMTYIDSEAR